MTKPLVIVESPTKARTIERFLGKGYRIEASYGHVRDLPNKAAEIPADIKKEGWSRLGVNIESNFEPLYVIPAEKAKRVKELKRLLKDASELLLATDEDREGESISWHLLEVLKPTVPVKRLVFHEITKEAIEESLAAARDLDENLVKAQETRRIVDRLFGYSISPLLWKKMRPRLSAGRVQSVALRLLVARERDRIRFKKAQYWDLKATLEKREGSKREGCFEAQLHSLNEKRVAAGRDFEPESGELSRRSELILLKEEDARELAQKLCNTEARIESVERKPFTTRPYPPFVTSTLQQEASRKFRFAAGRTMRLAQTLYENGFITYMRTDSTTLSNEALQGARSLIEQQFGSEYLPAEPRLYKTKVRNAQEAHEAIRPAGASFAHPEVVQAKLGIEAAKLYEMIWKRTLASQMKDSYGTTVAVQIRAGEALLRSSGKTIEFAGYLRAYVEGSDDPEAELADRERLLPPLKEGETVLITAADPQGHETQPPARYTEGSLIRELERRGIGRPSTWATIVDTVLSRTYAFKKGTALVPTFLATAVIGLMENSFKDLVDYDFTANLEDDLDVIARGESGNLQYLSKFWFGNGHAGLKRLVSQGEEEIDPREVCGIPLGFDEQQRKVEVRIGRYGPFLTNGEIRAGLPEILAPDELTMAKAQELLAEAERGPEPLGVDPATGLQIFVKSGRFGPYVQLGEMQGSTEKPKMVSLLQGMKPQDVTLDIALKLLELPKKLGTHPQNGQEVTVALGRYGPYVICGEETRTLVDEELSPIEISLEQAVAVLNEPKRRGRRAAASSVKEVGIHPVSEKRITLRSGRFGPYVTDGKINASVPRGSDPDSITLDDAVNLLEARAAKIAGQEENPPDDLKATRAKKSPRKGASSSAKSAETKSNARKSATKKGAAKGAAKSRTGAKKTPTKKKTERNKKSSSG